MKMSLRTLSNKASTDIIVPWLVNTPAHIPWIPWASKWSERETDHLPPPSVCSGSCLWYCMYLVKHRDNSTIAVPRYEWGLCDVLHISLAYIHGGDINRATLLKCQHNQEYNVVWLRGRCRTIPVAAMSVRITSNVSCDPHTPCLKARVC